MHDFLLFSPLAFLVADLLQDSHWVASAGPSVECHWQWRYPRRCCAQARHWRCSRQGRDRALGGRWQVAGVKASFRLSGYAGADSSGLFQHCCDGCRQWGRRLPRRRQRWASLRAAADGFTFVGRCSEAAARSPPQGPWSDARSEQRGDISYPREGTAHGVRRRSCQRRGVVEGVSGPFARRRRHGVYQCRRLRTAGRGACQWPVARS